jgi:general secretion pathway protein E
MGISVPPARGFAWWKIASREEENIMGGTGSLLGGKRTMLNGQDERLIARADALPANDSVARTSFAELVAGRPLVDRFSPRYLREIGMYLYEGASGQVHAVISDQQQLPLIDTIAWTLQRQVTPEFATAEDIAAALARVCGEESAQVRSNGSFAAVGRPEGDEDAIETLRDLASGAPVVRAVNEIIELALERRATDIHLEPVRDGIRVRIRVDGILTTVRTFTAELARPIVSRVKILAALNIAERRLPQDGRSRVRVGNIDADVRIATMPTAFGEAAILRLLQRERGVKAFSQIGLSSRDFDTFGRALKAPHGMIVVTGPTGSGKTTTLAAALETLNDGTRKILTVEDPIEYEIDGISQSQVKPAIGLTFASALRAFLRQDPDVIMVGEMRDTETASVGIQASLTGHLVLTTLHTNTAAAAITRLIDLQIEPFLLSASLQCVVAQRLVRLLCPHCRRSVEVDADFLHRDPRYRALAIEGRRVWEPGRCQRCAGTGYSGRRAVFEVLDIDDEQRHLITRGAAEAEIESCAKVHGMSTLIEDGVRTALAGETSLDEVLRVTASR